MKRRDVSDYTNYLSGHHNRPVSPRSVSRTPSSKYRDKTLTKTITNVSLQHSDVEEEGETDSPPKPQNVSKRRAKPQPDPVDHAEASNPEPKRLENDQRSISSEICISPSWSRAATKKREKKELKRQEKDRRELERKLKVEASRTEVNSRREPRRLTKRPPPSSRASSAHSWMPRPSTRSSIKSFWSNRSSRASSIQEPETDGEGSRRKDRKRGSWFPKMWTKRSSSKSLDAGSTGQFVGTDHFNPDAPNRSLHTVKKHADLRAAANTIDPDVHNTRGVEDEGPSTSSNGRSSISPVSTEGREFVYPSSLNGIMHQSHPPPTVPPPMSPPQDSPKSLGTTALAKRRPKSPRIQPSVLDGKRPITSSRIPVSSSRVSSRQNDSEEQSGGSSWRNSFDDPGKISQTARESLGSPVADSSLFSKEKKVKNDKATGVEKAARMSEVLLDGPPEQPKRDPIVTNRVAERKPERPKQKAAAVVLEKLENDRRQLDPVPPPRVSSNPRSSGSSVAATDSNKPNQGAKRTVNNSNNSNNSNTNNNNNRDASFRPSPLSGPPIVAESEGAAKAKIRESETGIALEGRLRSARLVQVASTKNLTGSNNNREIHDRMPTLRSARQKHASGNTESPAPKQQSSADDGQRLLMESTRPTIPPLDGNATGKKAKDAGKAKDKSTTSTSRPPSSSENKPTQRSRRNSFDFVQRLRPNSGKIETKLRKKRLSLTAGSEAENTAEPSPQPQAPSATSSQTTPLPDNTPPNEIDSKPRSTRPPGPSALRVLAGNISSTDDDVFSQPVKKPWLGNGNGKGKERIPSSPTLSSLTSSIGAATAGPSRRVAANNNQRIAKMFVICCQCRFWHDLPSEAYSKLAFPQPSSPSDEADNSNNETGNGKGVDRRGSDIVVDPPLSSDRHQTMNRNSFAGPSNQQHQHNPHRRPALSIQPVVKCCWCQHKLTKSCCAGWTALVQLHERHH